MPDEGFKNFINANFETDLKTVLIIDDEPQMRQMLARLLASEGYEVTQSENIKSGLKAQERNFFPVVLCDVKLPDGNGVEATKILKEKYPETEIILLTAYGNIHDGVQAIKNGAFDYLVKGDDNNKIIPLLSKAMDKALLQFTIRELQTKLNGKYSFENIIGKSNEIKEAIELAKKVAPTDATVLLTGETGTGKEVFAQAIHKGSKRNAKSFVALNCSAFSKEILESELFGHKAGAFTGAIRDKKGLIEEAHTGTLFLDEISEMSPDLQSKLLRVLENGEYFKVGDTKPHKVDVRIIAATNRNLKEECDKANFRLDLFYRLSAFQIQLPTLNERKSDMPELATHFLEHFSAKLNKRFSGMENDFVEKLKAHHWQGNVRELKNVMERACILESNETLTVKSLPFEFQINNIPSGTASSAHSLSEVEMQHIRKILHYTKGNKTETARLLGIGLTTLYRKIEEYKIS